MLSGGKVLVFLTGLLQYLAKNMALLFQNFLKFFVKIRFRLFKVAKPLKTFFAASLINTKCSRNLRNLWFKCKYASSHGDNKNILQIPTLDVGKSFYEKLWKSPFN